MTRMSLFTTLGLFCLLLTFATEAERASQRTPPQTGNPSQQASKQLAANQPTQMANPLHQSGKRKVVYCFRRKTDASDVTPGKSDIEGVRIVEGIIEGTIVQKLGGKLEEKGKTQYFATYVLMKGQDIDSVDEDGIRGHGYATIIKTTNRDDPLDDAAEVHLPSYLLDLPMTFGESRIVLNINLSKLRESTAEQGTLATKLMGGEKGAVSLPLLGEFRCEHGDCRIIPALQVTSEQGVVTIPVKDVVKFKKKPQSPEKKQQ